MGALANLGLWFFLMFGAYQIEFALGQPAYVTELYTDAQGRVQEEETTPNPHYLGGTLRVVAEGVDACLPNGQMNHLVSYLTTCLSLQENGLDPEAAELYEEVHFRDPLCALAVTAGVTAVGLTVFRKKDLK